MNKTLPFASIFLLLIFGCNTGEPIKFESPNGEKYRSEYHFTPKTGWMNDPNGMVYINGDYHLFYQYYPDSTVWGPMHWGHATSKDMLRWEHKPIALYPDSLGYIFSGSAVFDLKNSSGLGTAGNPPYIAIYTYHDPVGADSGSNTFQSQGIAFSLDEGKTWKPYDENPVLESPGIADFRDPKVMNLPKEDGRDNWIMTLAVKDEIHFYESSNLINWEKIGDFGKNIGAHGGVWECPDLLQFTAPNGEEKWVLLVSLNPGGPQMGSATQYFIGDFMDGKFIPDDDLIRWLDYGPDNYAGVTWSNVPESDGRTLFMGWMSNWLYAQVVPTKTWRSAMTLPRELSLFDVDGTLLVKSKPSEELLSLRNQTFHISQSSPLPGQAFELEAEIDSNTFSFKIENNSGEEVHFSKENGLVTVDRRKAGKSNFHPDFAASHSAPMSWEANELRLFVDANSIELFINDGELVMTSLVFPESPYTQIRIENGLEDLKIHSLDPVMKSTD
ncbi:glycoside hydrolase family 32 protein [Algoriphagus sediminis]|uniref:Glycoside hydrolase family 32 protein n=1 Tax=Algoriphagus sediminis TaxID=3057113 RepID=A0ABT7YAT1_9BACT|nr:glycoside hydrolase family 32 protein [Algoriphagus sediminis]MDN3203635.1 glycoside hydrolase family 32 protein [Algoriphagus sediminis]